MIATLVSRFSKSKAALLTPDELLVNVQLDEIYVKPKIQYKGDKDSGIC